MNKKDLSLVVALILLIPVWLFIDSRYIKPFFPDPEPSAPSETPVPADPTPSIAESDRASGDDLPSEQQRERDTVVTSSPLEHPLEIVETDTREDSDQPPPEPEIFFLANNELRLSFSSKGGGVLEAVLPTFPATLEQRDSPEQDPVHLDFSPTGQPALTYSGSMIGASVHFQVEELENGSLLFFREVQPGIRWEREVSLNDEGFEVKVVERWKNESDREIQIPTKDLYLGPMFPVENISQRFGPFLGIDARHTEGVGVKHYVKDLRRGTSGTSGLFEEEISLGLDWFTAKNKFFTQVLTVRPGDWPGAKALTLRARKGEGEAAIGMVQPSARLSGSRLLSGQVMERNFSFYVGPISMGNLSELGMNQDELIDFRLFRIFVPLGRGMMRGLNALHGFTGNWGVSIILLTFIVRMLFWPLTQKGAENMKKMSELSPQMKEIREKYKSNPQKLNQEMSAFYKENKVNPMAGCLPMVVQIPVFISLYGVLRVAVELRFARFLWISDLSEQEALFEIAGFPVNILPLAMGVTMILQQRMTPSNMDEQQRKIMMMMPVVFLFISYSMPAGLLLYWTTSNLISMYQTTHTRRRDAKRAADKKSSPAAVPAKKTGSAPASKPKQRKK